MTTAAELQLFTTFAQQHLASETEPASLDELFDLWRLEHPSPQDYSENVAAVAAALEDFRNGDRGRPAGQLSQELREQYGLNSCHGR